MTLVRGTCVQCQLVLAMNSFRMFGTCSICSPASILLMFRHDHTTHELNHQVDVQRLCVTCSVDFQLQPLSVSR